MSGFRVCGLGFRVLGFRPSWGFRGLGLCSAEDLREICGFGLLSRVLGSRLLGF